MKEKWEYEFCPKCGGILGGKLLKEGEPERLVCEKCSFIFFLDPKATAGTIFTSGGKIVLLRRGIEPGYGKWVFPGGYVNQGEVVEDAAIRETKEEVNVDVKIIHLLNVYSYPNRPVIVIVYAAEVTGGTLGAGDESLEVKTFSAEEIPWDHLAFPSTKDALRDYIARYCQ